MSKCSVVLLSYETTISTGGRLKDKR
jgi:hypothetical protein